jgi:hypothetical protein
MDLAAPKKWCSLAPLSQALANPDGFLNSIANQAVTCFLMPQRKQLNDFGIHSKGRKFRKKFCPINLVESPFNV